MPSSVAQAMAREYSDTLDTAMVPVVRGSVATLALLDKEGLDLTVVAKEVSGLAGVV